MPMLAQNWVNLTGNQVVDTVIACVAGAALLYLGYRVGRTIESLATGKVLRGKEQELFTAQRGFKQLYEKELADLKQQNESLDAERKQLNEKVEEYRKKAAGYGGMFSTGNKRADAMYALLMENEALEEALYSQNEKLKSERTDALHESLRSAGYRRVLMSQLMNDDRIKSYVREIIADDRQLPDPQDNHRSSNRSAGPLEGEEEESRG